MKALISVLALTLAVAFTGPAFAGDVTGTMQPRNALRRKCKGFPQPHNGPGLSTPGLFLFGECSYTNEWL